MASSKSYQSKTHNQDRDWVYNAGARVAARPFRTDIEKRGKKKV